MACSTFDDGAFDMEPIEQGEDNESEEEDQATTITAHDGCKYKVVTIGNQIWFAENLKAETFNDGSLLPAVTDDDSWDDDYGDNWLPARSVYDNEESNRTALGYLYNHYCVNPAYNGGKNICPEGWHIPSLSEWEELRLFVKPGSAGTGTNRAGGPLMETGTSYWNSNDYGTDEFGFGARAAGDRSGSSGSFGDKGRNAFYWTSTCEEPQSGGGRAHFISISQSGNILFGTPKTKKMGFSCRCIKD